MMRRILAGAAIAGSFLFGFSAMSASADIGPNPLNKDKEILSQLSVLDDLTVLNHVLNDSVKYVDLLTALHLQDINLDVLNNETGTGDDS
ncbi:hypothetical protein ITP53_54620 [Nonomuraea sp. K274]|uniref:Secreted protein n=1 Tax=Nonomuraea cypriaca TaxID=1187855 RepID=A0A931AP60_9ACTN|nr:hypothetical protein [Nonomuraea cypriaca]MBF8194544.1 hypothetical protein [Nonomuraea cypriaca]